MTGCAASGGELNRSRIKYTRPRFFHFLHFLTFHFSLFFRKHTLWLLRIFVEEQWQIILHTEGMNICSILHQLTESEELERIVALYIKKHVKQNSQLQAILDMEVFSKPGGITADRAVRFLPTIPGQSSSAATRRRSRYWSRAHATASSSLLKSCTIFWRTFDRFMVLHSEPGPSSFDQRPYRSFNATMGTLTNLDSAGVYRDVCENLTGDHPRIYRQVTAGCNVGPHCRSPELRPA